MILNRDILIELIIEKEYDDICYGGSFYELSIDDIYDIALSCKIGGDKIEEYDMLYYEMLNLIEIHSQYIVDKVNDGLEELCESYYGDPAFSSANDYWSYILG